MTYAAPPQPAAQQRPTTVTIASSLLYVVAAVQVISAIVSFAMIGPYKAAYAKALEGTGVEGVDGMVSGVATVTLVGAAIIALVLTIGYVLLGIFVGKGRNGARITTWVIGGISLCCLGLGTIGTLTGRASFQGSGDINGRSSAEVARILQDELPGWYQPVSAGLTALSFLCVLAVIILLALPASQPYFRKQELLWQPPVGYPAQPGQPGAAPASTWQVPPPAWQPGPTGAQADSGPAAGQPDPGPTLHNHGAGDAGQHPDQPEQTDQWKPPTG
jgi:hypothetical protein